MPEVQYYYVNGKISTCRRCKRKRTMDEDPDHLQFKTCYRCRMIERDQKKINQAKRKLAIDPNAIISRKPTYEPEPSGYVEVASASNSGNYYNQIGGAPATSAAYGSVPPGVVGMAPDGTPIYGNTSNVVDINANPVPTVTLDSFGVPGFNENNYSTGKSTDSAIYNAQLYSFNILSIDPKLNPLSLPDEQQILIQTNYLSKLNSDQHTIPALPQLSNGIFLAPNQCLSCLNNLKQSQLSCQLCENCASKESIIGNFDYFLTVLKVNISVDLNKVIFMSNISMDSLLKSSLSADKSAMNIMNKIYDKYIVPINQVTGAEFTYINTPRDSGNGSIKKFLRCVSDIVSNTLIDNENIDPVALQLYDETDQNTQNYFQQHAQKGCSSLICLSYDSTTGDLTLSFTHKTHR